ncbi:MAG: hypothetical protein Q7R33_05125 [Nitrosarchaeum sp.]|nr:hypothetical protein [Nitrosarchaeum sp.]
MTDTAIVVATSVWSFLAGFGYTQLLIVVFFMTLLLMLFVLVTKPCIKIGQNVISFGTKRQKNSTAHANCIYNIDFFHIVAKTTEIVTKICYIDTIEIISQRMSYVEERMKTIKSLYLIYYANLLKEKIKTGSVTAHEDYIGYHRLVESLIQEDFKSYLKQSLATDDFESLSDTEYRVFVNEKFDYLSQIAEEFMDLWYLSGKMLVSREEVRTITVSLRSKLLEICFDIYTKAIRIKEDRQIEKENLQHELDNFFERIVGVKRQ